MSHCRPIVAALSVSCLQDGEPPEASGVQYGHEGVVVCWESSVEPWDPDVVPEGFVDAPSVTRDAVRGAWVGDAALADGQHVDLAVDLSAADPMELVWMAPDEPRCPPMVRTPTTVVVEGGSLIATTLSGYLLIGPTRWAFDSEVDGSEVIGALAPADGTPLEDVTLAFYATSEAMDGSGSLNGGLDFVFFESEPGVVVPGAVEGWAAVDLSR